MERAAKKFASARLPTLTEHRAEARATLRQIPERMQRFTNQASLVLELVDDFRAKRYRDVSWFTIAVATGALLYCVSPADAIPDFIPLIGVVDEAFVLAGAMRAIQGDLMRYAKYKGYSLEKYFA